MKKIVIKTSDIPLHAEPYDAPTAQRIYNALPIKNQSQRCGDELYFTTPIRTELEPVARDLIDIAEFGCRPAGSDFCNFEDDAPMRVNEKPRAASAVNVFRPISRNTGLLQKVKNGEIISASKAE